MRVSVPIAGAPPTGVVPIVVMPVVVNEIAIVVSPALPLVPIVDVTGMMLRPPVVSRPVGPSVARPIGKSIAGLPLFPAAALTGPAGARVVARTPLFAAAALARTIVV